MFFDIIPVLISAVLSALIWDFFFIPPHFTFTVGSAEDSLMLLMFFIVATINAILTYKIRQIEKIALKKEERGKTLKLYNTLLNSLSHELRTPIAAIIGATDNLQSREMKLTEENRTDLISEISKAALRLNRHVENLLNMSRLDSGIIRPNLDWCDINELIHTCVNQMPATSEDHNIEIHIEENLPLFKLDFGLIEQAINNLLLNAIYYTPAQSTIKIKAYQTSCSQGHFDLDIDELKLERDNKIDYLNISISDNGIGFPTEEIDLVFDKFYRLKNAKTGGTGLGLSIVKGFVEAHNGSITLENDPQHGAKFTIVIPAETSYLNNLKNE
jgi:two-component system sensor histidine kinase KdpD